MFLSPLGERLGEGVNPKTVSCITPSPSLIWLAERQGYHSIWAEFLGSTADRFFVPTYRRVDALRAAAVKGWPQGHRRRRREAALTGASTAQAWNL